MALLLIGEKPLLTYLRYDVDLQPASVKDLLKEKADTIALDDLSAMDAPENMQALHSLGTAAGKVDVKGAHFPAVFDLA